MVVPKVLVGVLDHVLLQGAIGDHLAVETDVDLLEGLPAVQTVQDQGSLGVAGDCKVEVAEVI